jgi:AcrR family transcriptional regulator
MMTKKKESAGRRSGWTQRRGEVRREQLMDAACALLERQEIEEISLEDIASRAGVPVASAYHFYRDRNALFGAVVMRYGEHFTELLRRPLPAAKIHGWQDIMALSIHRAVRYYAANPAARKLLIDGKTPPHLKLLDRATDRSLGALMEEQIAARFELPELPERQAVFFHAVEIVDLMLQISVIQWRKITPRMEEHARIASVAYLEQFIPKQLPRREP